MSSRGTRSSSPAGDSVQGSRFSRAHDAQWGEGGRAGGGKAQGRAQDARGAHRPSRTHARQLSPRGTVSHRTKTARRADSSLCRAVPCCAVLCLLPPPLPLTDLQRSLQDPGAAARAFEHESRERQACRRHPPPHPLLPVPRALFWNPSGRTRKHFVHLQREAASPPRIRLGLAEQQQLAAEQTMSSMPL